MGRERIIFLPTPDETIKAGRLLGERLPPNSILALSGDLGAGKTTFVQGLAQGLRIDELIQSPTFVFLNSYSGTLPLYHFDLYRMERSSDFLGLGFDEYWEKGGIVAIEWPERILPLLPEQTTRITLSTHQTGRSLLISGEIAEELLEWPPCH